MNKISHAIDTFYFLESKAAEKNLVTSLHPLSKVLISIAYVSFLVSFPKYTFFPLLAMSCYPLILFTLTRIPIKHCFRQIKLLLFLVCMIGIFNPLFDTVVLIKLGPLLLTSGMLSMLTLILKGTLAVISSYLLIATTNIEEICYALKQLHIPDLMISILLLSYRHLLLLMFELKQMYEAYQLRAAIHQKGLHIKTWGTFIGYFLLHSIEYAESVSESMTLRGFHGNLTIDPKFKFLFNDWFYVTFWMVLFIFLHLI